MKKFWRKATAVVATVAMLASIGMPAFAAEEAVITDVRANEICAEISQQYGVELIQPKERKQLNMSEEEFRLRTELLAVIGASAKYNSSELEMKAEELLNNLNAKYPVEDVAVETENMNTQRITFYAKTISKNTNYITITTRAKYMVNTNNEKLFVGVDDVDNDITGKILPKWESRYKFLKTPDSTTQCILQTAGQSMLVTMYGDVMDITTDIAFTSIPQTVNYNNTDL